MTDRLIDIGGKWVNPDEVVAVSPGNYWQGTLAVRVWLTGGTIVDCDLRPDPDALDAAVPPGTFVLPPQPRTPRWWWSSARRRANERADTLYSIAARAYGDYQRRRWEAADRLLRVEVDHILALIVDDEP